MGQWKRMSTLMKLTDDEIVELPVDRLGFLVLEHVSETSEWNSYNFLNWAQQQGRTQPALFCLSEGMNWLIANGLIARGKPGQSNSDSIFVSRLGRRVLEEGPALALAERRLDVDLHGRLGGARSQFLVGEFELAAFAAMREVEIRVRELANADTSVLGVKLMRSAFNPDNGPLADPQLDPGERVGVMELFAGAIGTFKNPPSHRQVDYSDPTEASEVILLADLLMRLLDRVAARVESN